eukprot:CAMPEP_0172535752 /NCGR_PEP_ID=MMETSP1067-20121228/7612_1 /TAXON_ID=265564 ORGANISM="Thalassiosira punctigera, Strain Tpunct2005C2" /NCGR_SAMPLE_ID=MMETSP1067 /ASSEMBLY_ACC=CAM_ASM_000444 /LENGTH=813 /DNA_ID=CAMNT_0013320697 /DNA_START=16 /DNA_END=2457 /DNA_ORIENTATION=+
MPPPSPSTTRGRRPRQLNPAFASAHGLAQRRQQSSNSSSSIVAAATGPARGGNAGGNRNRVDAAIRSARSTGRLNLSSCSLAALPDAIFDLRSGVEIDLSMDSSSNPGSWQSRGEDEVAVLDASDNPLSGGGRSLDDRLAKFVALKTLRARRSGIIEMPWRSAILNFDHLLTLDVGGNDLTEAMLECLPMTVREVDLSNNKLSRLVEGTAAPSGSSNVEPAIVLPSLLRLDVSGNQLTRLPGPMEVPSLQTLRFGNNRIEELSGDLISQCAGSLTSLEGTNNRLRTVPNLLGCKRLTTVDLGDNALREVPAIGPKVVRINLVNNALSSIGDLFSGAQVGRDDFRSELVEILLRGNGLRDLDEDVARCLTNATLLDAGQNELRDVPRVLGYLPLLRRAPLDGNPIRAIRTPLLTDTAALKVFLRKRGPAPPGPGYLAGPDLAAGGGDAGRAPLPTSGRAKSVVGLALVGTFTLDLAGKRLDALPAEIGNELASILTNGDGGTVGGRIKNLNVSKNLLKNLDDWLSAMPHLMAVEASQNRIETLPSCIGDVPLAELRMARNGLSSAALARSPVCCIGKQSSPLVMSLTCLDLSGNHLEWLPSDLAKLPALSTLVLANNNITTLAVGTKDGMESGWREGFKAIETLNLSDNKISDLADLPRCLAACCPLIRTLSLANNELSVIPPALGMLRSLVSADLRGNPQRGIRTNVLDRNATEILSYLRSRMDGEELRAMEAKLAGSSSAAKDPSSSAKSDATSSNGNERAEELKRSIQDVTLQLNNVHLTEAKKYALKKTLKMHKAALIKEERRIRMEAKK